MHKEDAIAMFDILLRNNKCGRTYYECSVLCVSLYVWGFHDHDGYDDDAALK